MPQQTPASATADPGERERGSRHMVPSVSKRDLCRRYCPVPAVAAWSKFVTAWAAGPQGKGSWPPASIRCCVALQRIWQTSCISRGSGGGGENWPDAHRQTGLRRGRTHSVGRLTSLQDCSQQAGGPGEPITEVRPRPEA